MADVAHRRHLSDVINGDSMRVSPEELEQIIKSLDHYKRKGTWPANAPALPSFCYQCEGKAGAGKTEGLLDGAYMTRDGLKTSMSGFAHQVTKRLAMKEDASLVSGNTESSVLKTLLSHGL